MIFVSLKWIWEHFWFYCDHEKKARGVCLSESGTQPAAARLTGTYFSLLLNQLIACPWQLLDQALRLLSTSALLRLLILEKGPGTCWIFRRWAPFSLQCPPISGNSLRTGGPFQGVFLALTMAWATTEQERRWWALVVSTATVLSRGSCPQYIPTCFSLFVKCAFFKVTRRLGHIFHAQKWINDAKGTKVEM